MRNIRLTLEYDGTNFCGWQLQPKVRTVQGELESSLKKLLQEKVRIIGSGRTDVGVHALGQVANFHTKSQLSPDSIHKGLNSLLPEDVIVLKTEEVPLEFHARFDAKKRMYRYVISRRKRAIGRFYCWYVDYDLDLVQMQRASELLIGERDFKSFCQADVEVKHYKCKVESTSWREKAEELIFEITANRFLHGMVRTIVGTLIDVGWGKISPLAFEKIIEARDRRAAGRTAPAKGLFLVRVWY